MIAFDYPGYSARELREDDEPELLLPIFNSNPDFLDDNTLNVGVDSFDVEHVGEYLWQNSAAENSHCVLVEDASQEAPVAVLSLLLPHPGTGQPWIGSFLANRDHSGDEFFHSAIGALEEFLSSNGWESVSVSPMQTRTGDVARWESRGYKEVRRALDNDKRAVVVMCKTLEILR